MQNDAFLGILDNIIRPLWAPNNGQQAIANPLKLVSNISSFMDWLNTPVDQVNPTKVDPAGFCCDYDLWPTEIMAGYRIDTPANFNFSSVWLKDWAINSTANWDNSTEIGVGLAPGVSVVHSVVLSEHFMIMKANGVHFVVFSKLHVRTVISLCVS